MIAILIAAMSLVMPGLAQPAPLELMATCGAVADNSRFTLYREIGDKTAGSLFNFVNGRPIEHKVEIGYTNAGARAIVVSDGLPMLIIVGTGGGPLEWNGKNWECEADF